MTLAATNRFFHWAIIGVLSPVLVLMIQSKGASLPEVGLLMAVLSACVVVFELPGGILSDRIGRKRIYLLAMTVFILSFGVLLVARGFGALALAFGLFGLARALASGSIEADFIDRHLERHGPEKLGHFMTVLGVAETLGLALGALAGGLLPDAVRPWLPGVDPYSGNLLVAMALAVTLVVLTLVTHPTSRAGTHLPLGAFLKETLAVLRGHRRLLVLLAGAALWGFAFSALEVYWQPRLAVLAGGSESTAVFGYLNGGYFIAAALGTVAATGFLALVRRKDLAAIGWLRIVLGAGLILLGLQNHVAAFAVVYLVLMGFNGLLSVPEHTVFNLAIPEDKRSSLLSLGSLALQAGGIAASVGFSLVVAGIGIPWVWALAGGLFAGSSVLYFLLARTSNRG